MAFPQVGVEAVIKNLNQYLTGMDKIDSSNQKAGTSADKSAGLLSKFGGTLLKVGGVMAATAVAGVTAITGAMVKLGIDGVKVAREFEDQMAILSTAAKDTGLTFDDLQEAAIAVGGDTRILGASASGAADAMTGLFKSGLTTTEVFGDLNAFMDEGAELGGALRASFDLAAATELDVAQAADLASVALATFGGEMKTDTERANFINTALNNMVQAADASVAEVSDLAQALKNVGPTAAALGIPIEDVNNALALLSTRGITGAEAGTQLKSMLLNLQRPTDAVQASLTALGVSLFDAEGNFRGLPVLVNDFANALFNENEVMIEVGGRTAEQNELLAAAQKRYEQLTARLAKHNAGLVVMSESALAKANAELTRSSEIITELGGIHGTATTTTRQLTEEQRNLAIQTLAGSYGQTAMNALMQAQIELNEEGVGGWEAMAEATKNAATIQEQAAAKSETLSGKMEALEGVVETLKIRIGNALIPIITDLVDKFTGIIEEHGPLLVTAFENIADFITEKVVPGMEVLANWLAENIPLAIETAVDFWTNSLLPAIKEVNDFIVEKIIPTIELVVDWLQENIPLAIEIASDFWTNTLQPAIKEVNDFIVEKVIPTIELVVDWLQENVPVAIQLAADFWETVLLPAIQTAITFIIEDAIPAIQDVVQWLEENIPIAIEAAAEFWETVLKPAMDTVVQFINESVIPAVETVVLWLQENIPLAIETASEFWETTLKPAIDTVVKFLNDEAIPAIEEVATFLIEEWGKMVGWVEENWGLIQSTIETVLGVIGLAIATQTKEQTDTLKTEWENGQTTIELIWGIIQGVISTTLTLIRGTLETVMKLINGDFEGAWDTVRDTVEQAFDDILRALNSSTKEFQQVWINNWNQFKEILTKKWAEIKKFFKESLAAFPEIITEQIENIRNAGQAVVDAFFDGIQEAWQGVVSWWSGAIGSLADMLPSLPGGGGADGESKGGYPGVPGNKLRAAGNAFVENIAVGVADATPDLVLAFSQALVEVEEEVEFKVRSIRDIIIEQLDLGGALAGIAEGFAEGFGEVEFGEQELGRIGILGKIVSEDFFSEEAVIRFAQQADSIRQTIVRLTQKRFMAAQELEALRLIADPSSEQLLRMRRLGDLINVWTIQIGRLGENLQEISSIPLGLERREELATQTDFLERLLSLQQQLIGIGGEGAPGMAAIFQALGGLDIAQLNEIDLLRIANQLIEDQNAGLEDQLLTYEEIIEAAREYSLEQQRLERIEERRADIAFLQQQLELLDLIAEHGLDAADILGGLELGLEANINDLLDAIVAAMDDVIAATEDALGIASPAKKFVPMGMQIDAGIAEGIISGIGGPLSAVNLLSSQMMSLPSANVAQAPIIQHGGASISMDFGGNNISNDVGLARFEGMIRRVVRQEVGGIQ